MAGARTRGELVGVLGPRAFVILGLSGLAVAQPLLDLFVGAPSTYSATLAQQALFKDLPTADGTEPFVLAGSVRGGSSEPPELLAAINGRLAGVVGGYRPTANGWAFTGYVADFYREGANEVTLYEVSRDRSAVTLHPVV